MQLIEFTDRGLYCRQGDFYIDPWKPVKKAVITHAHSDHARWGSHLYLCHHDTKPILQIRLGDVNVESEDWNTQRIINNVKVSFHPAGHIIGSAQVRVEFNGEVWVVSGDYKVEDDGISQRFEPVRCNTFITESTFGLPIYEWKPQAEIFADISSWIKRSHDEGRVPVVITYSLGKAQRVMQCIRQCGCKIFVHGAIWNIHQKLMEMGYDLPEVTRVNPEIKKEEYRNAVVVAPPSADGTPWMRRFSPSSVGVCSGWMQVRGNVRRRNADAGFALSDHADWKGLLSTVKETGAEQVFVTHGFQTVFSRYLNEHGIRAAEVKTEYGGEEEEQDKPSTTEQQDSEINSAQEE